MSTPTHVNQQERREAIVKDLASWSDEQLEMVAHNLTHATCATFALLALADTTAEIIANLAASRLLDELEPRRESR